MRELSLKESKALMGMLRCYPLIGDIEVSLNTSGDLVLPVIPVIRFNKITQPQTYPVKIKYAYRDIETFVTEYYTCYHAERKRPTIITNGFTLGLQSCSSNPILIKGIVVPHIFRM